MADTGLNVAAHLEEDLQWFVQALDAWISRDSYEMGGGSILAARWHHRQSTDIDLFFDARTHADVPLDEIIQGFRALESQGQIERLEIHPPRGFSCERATTPLSFFPRSRSRRFGYPTRGKRTRVLERKPAPRSLSRKSERA